MSYIYTIGHSNHSTEQFIALLVKHGVDAIADVRSTPASRFMPQFNRETLKGTLHDAGIDYVFLGRELGARPDNPTIYEGSQVSYMLLARTPEFAEGINRLRNGMQTRRIAIMCAEREPLDCHRTVLIGRMLAEGNASVGHIHSDGRIESHDDAMVRLMVGYGLDQADLFNSRKDLLDEALRRQELRIAYVKPEITNRMGPTS